MEINDQPIEEVKPKKPRKSRKPALALPYLVKIGAKRYGSLEMPVLQSGHLVLVTPRGQEFLPVYNKRFTIVTLEKQPDISSGEVEYKIKKALGITDVATQREFEVQEFNRRRDRALSGAF